jgi:hypothetical protein
MTMPKPDAESRAWFESLVPEDPRLNVRPMKEYVVLPPAWRKDPAKARAWVGRSLAWVQEMPPKKGR